MSFKFPTYKEMVQQFYPEREKVAQKWLTENDVLKGLISEARELEPQILLNFESESLMLIVQEYLAKLGYPTLDIGFEEELGSYLLLVDIRHPDAVKNI